MEINLPPKLEQLVQSKQSGHYNSAGDVVREALRLLEQRGFTRRKSESQQEFFYNIDESLTRRRGSYRPMRAYRISLFLFSLLGVALCQPANDDPLGYNLVPDAPTE